MRLRDELWFKGREWFQEKACSMPQDDALIAELTAPTYTFTSTGKMVVESKADMKKRGCARLTWPMPSSSPSRVVRGGRLSAIEGQCGDARLGQRRACYVSKMSTRSPGSPARGFLMSSLGVFGLIYLRQVVVRRW